MGSSSSRPRTTTRRSPRRAARQPVAAAPAERPLSASLAAVFGVLVAAVDGYLTWLLRVPGVGWHPTLIVPVLLGVLAVAAAGAVFLGLHRAWLLLAVAAVLPLLGLLAVVVLFAALGAGRELWGALALLVAPVGALVLALRSPVRDWTGAGRAGRAAGGRRGARSSR